MMKNMDSYCHQNILERTISGNWSSRKAEAKQSKLLKLLKAVDCSRGRTGCNTDPQTSQKKAAGTDCISQRQTQNIAAKEISPKKKGPLREERLSL